AHLRRVGLPHDQQPRRLEPSHQLAVPRRRVAGEEAAPVGRTGAGIRREQVLEQEGHAGERPVGQRSRRLLPPAIVKLEDHRVEARIRRLDALDGRLHQLGGPHLLAPDQVRQRRRVEAVVFRKRGHRSFRLSERRRGRARRSPTGGYRRTRCAPRCAGRRRARSRSEEHTSELQSPYDLVCRLLLEKKKLVTHTKCIKSVYQSLKISKIQFILIEYSTYSSSNI